MLFPTAVAQQDINYVLFVTLREVTHDMIMVRNYFLSIISHIPTQATIGLGNVRPGRSKPESNTVDYIIVCSSQAGITTLSVCG